MWIKKYCLFPALGAELRIFCNPLSPHKHQTTTVNLIKVSSYPFCPQPCPPLTPLSPPSDIHMLTLIWLQINTDEDNPIYTSEAKLQRRQAVVDHQPEAL